MLHYKLIVSRYLYRMVKTVKNTLVLFNCFSGSSDLMMIRKINSKLAVFISTLVPRWWLINLDSRQMHSLGMVSVLVSDVVDGVFDISVRIDVGVATVNDETLVLLTGVHQLAGLLMGLPVGEFITVLVSINADVVRWCLFHNFYLPVVVRGCREGDGHEGAEGDDLQEENIN